LQINFEGGLHTVSAWGAPLSC